MTRCFFCFFWKKRNTAYMNKATTVTESCSCKLQVWCKSPPSSPQPLLLCHVCLQSASWIGLSRQVIPTWLPRCIRILLIHHTSHVAVGKKDKKVKEINKSQEVYGARKFFLIPFCDASMCVRLSVFEYVSVCGGVCESRRGRRRSDKSPETRRPLMKLQRHQTAHRSTGKSTADR